MAKLGWIWISPHYTDFYEVMNSFPVIYSVCFSQLPKSTERNEKGIMDDEADKKQINLFVYPTSIWNIYIHMTLYLLSVFLHKIHAKFVKWKMWSKNRWKWKKSCEYKNRNIFFLYKDSSSLMKVKTPQWKRIAFAVSYLSMYTYDVSLGIWDID